MTQTASDDWWQRSLARLGVQPRADNDAPVMMDMVLDIQRHIRSEVSDFGAVNPTYRDNRHA